MERYSSGAIILIVCIIYGFVLQQMSGKRTNTHVMVKAFALVFTLGWVVHMAIFFIMSSTGERTFIDWILMVYYSVQYTLEMFVTKSLIFKGAVAKSITSGSFLFNIYFLTYFLAIITSALVIFHFISRWAYGRRWLEKRRNIRTGSEGENHIFLGICNASKILARNIRREDKDCKIIFIDIPDDDDKLKGLSIWDIISKFFSRDNSHDDIEADVILRAGEKMKGLMPWLNNCKNSLYILSDDQEANLNFLEQLWQSEEPEGKMKVRCHIYCHANKEGLVSRYDTVTDIHDRITFIDSSFLSIQSLKSHHDLTMYPVNYVNIGKDPISGRKLGWVENGFNCAIIGFGETGQEALKFLYEFGTFVGKDKEKVPFRCNIFDKDAISSSAEFRRKITLPDDKEISFESCATDTAGFWDHMEKIISTVNYIVVCLGNDTVNLKTAIDIAEFAFRKGRDLGNNFVIAVRQQIYSTLDKDTLSKTNRTFRDCIRPFGMEEDIWNLRVIRNDDMNEMARHFYTSYLALTSDESGIAAWEKRDKKLLDDEYKIRNKARRQIAQDYSNCLHALTKRQLCDHMTYEASDMILKENEGSMHVNPDCPDSETEILEYLAIGEHLRWNASHTMLGYSYGPQTCDLKGTHSCLVPYNELDETTKHYDWLVVRNSLK